MPVSVMPWMKVRCVRKKRTTMGKTVIVVPAMSSSHWAPKRVRNPRSPSEMVNCSYRLR